ncbi:ATP-binding protein [Aquirhabdus sp.]|uniref:ATP-binding protein n=1 Tax=Aquirhabdus sp. TaxID=2824160 RepID=UPI00396CC8FD
MASAQTSWFHRLSIQNAYGQLVALIFVPITILTLIGASLVISETARATKAEQRSRAEAVLARYQLASKTLIPLLEQPDGAGKARNILQNILGEENVKRAALIDIHGIPRLSMGYNADADWAKFSINRQTFGPLPSSVGNNYGLRVGFATDSPIWLVIDMDNQPLELARYRVWGVLVITGLITLLLLLLCLSFYSTRWISPIYELRMLLQRLSITTLNQPIESNSYGEMRLLQKDFGYFLRRLHSSVVELQAYSDQTEDDLRQTLDTIEMQNITYRQARDSALQASTTKSVFLANISHELRTPLNSIDGFINLLSRRGELSDEQTLYVQTIRKSSAHLLALINDVLDFSKIEAGKLVLDKAPFNLEETVFDVIDMLTPLASEKNLNIAVYFYDDVPRQAQGDALRLKQILTNLVSNAIKFTQQGEVIIRVRLDDPAQQPQRIYQNLIHFSVQDSGIGLGSMEKDQLFQSFHQGDPSVNRQYGGTGLGLAIVRQLAQLMGGEVGFEDNAEQGATFWFTALLGVTQENFVDWPQFNGRRVLAHIEHRASLNVLRAYLGHMAVELEQASSLPDLFGRLTAFEEETQGRGWVITDADAKDTPALLREIRTRYSGALVIYGYQMAIDPVVLTEYQVQALYQPVSRVGLLSVLEPKNKNELAAAPRFEGRNLHVLAVDDHAPNLLVLDALLGDLGIQTTKASSGLEAIEYIESRLHPESPEAPFDLIFMDIQMPRMSGLETTQRIRLLETEYAETYHEQQHTPIIALTAHALSDERERLLAAGMDDYFSKPIQQAQLVDILERWTGQFATNSPNAYFDNSAIEPVSHPIVDWQLSLKLAAGKVDLARDLLRMLIEALPTDKMELIASWESRNFESLMSEVHRLHGGSRYTGTPTLRKTTGVMERALTAAQKNGTLINFESETALKTELLVNFSAMIDAIDAVLAYPFEQVGLSVNPP